LEGGPPPPPERGGEENHPTTCCLIDLAQPAGPGADGVALSMKSIPAFCANCRAEFANDGHIPMTL
jgi:hypothetical protein